LENSQLVTQRHNLGLHSSAGLKRRADQGNKCDENRTHLESDDNLTNDRNVCVISPDQVFGIHRRSFTTIFTTFVKVSPPFDSSSTSKMGFPAVV
jgi:hypothetical protein